MSGPMTPSAAPDSLPLMRPAIFRGIGSVRAGFSTREGGASAAPYGSLNLGLSTADDPAAVAENRRRFFAALGATPEDAAIAGQVHGTDVLPVTSGGLYRRVDGLVTATPGVLLCMIAADCASVLFADPEARVVGACHAGWRGAVGGVAEETLRQMATLGADAARTLAYVGPCISREAFEVGPDVAAHFAPENVRAGRDDRHHADLPAELRSRLVAVGIPEANIETDGACTARDARYFSHRASGGTTGRMMGAIVLVA